MVSVALEKMIRNIKNFKPQYRKCAFSYFTRCAEQGFWGYLVKYYKHLNKQREAMLRYAEMIEQECPEAARKLREEYSPREEYVSGRRVKKARLGQQRRNNRTAPEM